jgi:preprotein translocase subunit SecG
MQALNIFYVLIAIAMVALILVQKGAGATAGAAFGSGASGTVFGARGAGNFLTRTTWVLATLFCSISLLMAVLVSRMSDAPETDLGVLTDSPAVSESADFDATETGLNIPDEIDGAQTSSQSVIEEAVSAEGQSESVDSSAVEVVEDIPSVEETGAATTEVDQADPVPGSKSDGS